MKNNVQHLRKTILCDIDGCIFKHSGSMSGVLDKQNEVELLPGVKEAFRRWDQKSYCVVLITARKECMKELTEKQLAKFGLFYDQLIMGVGNGARIVINDHKVNDDGSITPRALAFDLPRNQGFDESLIEV